MPTPGDSIADIERLVAISAFDLYSEEVRVSLSRFARRGAEQLHLPIALVSIVLDRAQYVAGTYGVDGWIADADGTPVEWSFCANAVRDRAPYVVEDAESDEQQHDNPLVTHDGIRCYAGAPLITSGGHVLGAYCVIGQQPRRFEPGEIELLNSLAAQVVAEIESHRLSLPPERSSPARPAVTKAAGQVSGDLDR